MNDSSPDQIETIRRWLGTGSINIFGKQFAGKDTQCSRLAELLGGAVIGGGDILRSSNVPAHVSDAMSRGELSPTAEYRAIVTPYFTLPKFRGQPLLLSSVGRMQGEEDTILAAADASGHPVRAVVSLDVSDSEVWRRYEAAKLNNTRDQRADDEATALTRRLIYYRESTTQVLATYQSLGLLIHIDGEQTADKVTAAILDALYRRAYTRTD